MAELKVNTDQIFATANNLKGINDRLRDDFETVESAIRRLNTYWDGSASNNAMEKFNSLKEAYCEARYIVIDNYVTFLQKIVSENYEIIEEANVSLADQFK